jgi:hypothetical protein
VLLTDITTFGRKYKLTSALFDEVNTAEIVSMALVIEGVHVGQTLNLDWGNFAFVPSVNHDPANPDITPAPEDASGNRPALTGFASNVNPENGAPDFSNVTVNMVSPTFAQMIFNTYNGNSFGGAFISYDLFGTTGTTETINLNTVFPTGLVFQLDSPTLTSVFFEVTDITGKKDKVRLADITTFGQKYKLEASIFDEVDTTQIASMAFVVEGVHVNETLNLDWGTFAFIPSIGNDPSNPAITLVPEDSTGSRPTLTGFASTVNPENGAPDFSNVSVNMTSATDGVITFNTYNSNSFGGAFLSYDNFGTEPAIETINLNTAFPDGIVLQLASSSLSEIFLEVTDVNGNRDQVRLTGITGSNQRYKVLVSAFDEVDVTQISTIALVATGQHVGQDLNFSWGNFAFIPSINNDPTNPAITIVPVDSLGNRPTLTGFASTVNPENGAPDFSNVSVNMT